MKSKYSKGLAISFYWFCILTLFSTQLLQGQSLTEQTGGANPMNGVNAGSESNSAIADLDGDGDWDLLVGLGNGQFGYYRNNGTSVAPTLVQQFGGSHPMNGVDVGGGARPFFWDIDNDGDYDLFVGEDAGNILYFRNTGNSTSPTFTQQFGGNNPFNGATVNGEPDITFADVDNDGDVDAFIGGDNGRVRYFRNTGNVSSPTFAQQFGGNNPMNGFDVGTESSPALMDYDADGDYDMFVGDTDGDIHYYRNTGTVAAPTFTEITGANNPFDGLNFGEEPRPMPIDLNADGDTDVLVSVRAGTFRYFTGTDTGSSPIDDTVDMTYTSSTVTQNSNDVSSNTTDAQVIGIQVVTAGHGNELDLTSINFNTTGSSDATNDFSNAKLYYTGNSSTFATTTQVGSTIASPNGAFTITGTQTLEAATNYFWLSYDIGGGATAGNLVDGQATQITVDASNYAPSTTAPAGARTIITQPYASFPYSTGFESGSFDNVWVASSTNGFGRVQVTTNNGPSSGSYHMTMDSNTDASYAGNNADLYIDLDGETNVVLDFNFKDFGDEDTNVDGIYLSDDGGQNFSYVHEIDPGDYGNTVWSYIRLDIDALAAGAGLTLNSTFVIRFHQFDNYPITDDGFAFDNIEVKTGPVYASFPYSNGFELGYFSEEWVTAGDNGFGRLQVTTANTPNSGAYHMTMDVNTGGNDATNYADLHVDLAGQTDVLLDFYFKDFGDEDTNVDGIYLSDDGGASFPYYYQIDPTAYTDETWSQIILDIDALAAGAGLTLNSTFVVRFLQYDNYGITFDGIAIDDVQLRTTYYAAFPYYDGFESGGFGNEWSTLVGANNETIISTANTPYQGSYHMTMDVVNNDNFALNQAMLHIDLSGQTQVELSMYWKEFGDETHAQDGIYFSDDGGASFSLVHSFDPANTTNNTWAQVLLDVDALASGAGLSLTNQFVISFEQYDNYNIANDGMAFDEITLYVPNTLTNWTGNVSTNWATAGNWSNGVPGCSDIAIIPDVSGASNRFPVVASFTPGEVGSIFIEPNASLTVTATLNVCNDWDNQGTAGIGTGTVVFQGTSRQEITGTTDWQNMTINNVGGDILINDAQNISGVLTLTDGIVDTQFNAFTMNSGSSTTGASAASFINGRVTKVGNTDFEFPIGNGTDWAPLAIANLSGDAATQFSADYARRSYIVTDQLMVADPNGDLNNISVLEYWNLDHAGTASTTDVTLYWKDQTFSAIQDYADLQIAHYNGSVWENMGQNAVVSTDPGWIAVTGVSSFSPFTFASVAGTNTLPVDLVSFTAHEENGKVLLDWQTASEINNDFFEVQRSENGENWEIVGQVDGNGTINEVLDYSYTDHGPLFGVSYYRLRQVDFDGQFEYSSIQRVNIEFEGRDLQVSLYPNPTTEDNINLRLRSLNNRNKVKLRLMDMSGKIFMDQFVEIGKFSQDKKIIANTGLHKGIYILEVDQNGVVSKHKIIIR